jgi:glycosyltransferase 2 family protein
MFRRGDIDAMRPRNIIGLAGSIFVAAGAVWQLDGYSILIAGAFSSGSILLLAFRWAYLRASNQHLDFTDCYIAIIANVFNFFTPAALGADVYRLAKADDRAYTVGLLVIERVFGLAAFGAWFLAGYLVLRNQGPVDAAFTVVAFAFAAFAVLPLVLVVATRIPLQGLLWEEPNRWLLQATSALRVSPDRLLVTAILSVLSAGCWLAAMFVLAEATGLSLSFAGITVSSTITELARLLPISVQGIGVREATFAWLAALLGGRAGPAFAACATAYALHYSVSFIIAGIARTLHRRVTKPLACKPLRLWKD